MRNLIIYSILFLVTTMLSAQSYPITNGSINTCSGTFTDSGGSTGVYGPNENLTYTICPGSQGGNTRLSFSSMELKLGDDLCFYDGNSIDAPLIACASNYTTPNFDIQATNQTGCLTTVFVSNSSLQNDGWEATISCSPNCQEIIANITSSIPSTNNKRIDVCYGSDVTINGGALFPSNNQSYPQDENNCTFIWNFADGQSFQGQELTYHFAQAGGYPISLKVIDQYGCESENGIDYQVRVAKKPIISFGDNSIPNICANKSLTLATSTDGTNAAIQITQPEGALGLTKTVSDSLPLPDGTGASYISSINYTEFDDNQTIQDVNDIKKIFVNMEHSWLRDLEIFIECPNGQSAILHNHPANTGGEVFLGEPNELDEALATPIPGIGYDYSWTPNASNSNWIEYVNSTFPSTLPSNEYQSSEPLTQLIGCPLNGDWQIKITDLWASDNGYVFSWGIGFNEDLYTQETFQPVIDNIEWTANDIITSYDANSIDISSNWAGIKKLKLSVYNDFGCQSDTIYTVNVLPPTSPLCYECESYKTALKDTALCLGQDLNYDATFDKSFTKSLGFDALENAVVTGTDFASKLTISNVKPAVIGNVTYRIDSVEIEMASTTPVDVNVFLQSPTGVKLLLGSAIGVANTSSICFTPNASQTIAGSSAPYNGQYAPEGDWTVLQAQPINGDWKLLVQSNNPSVQPVLVHWNMTFRNDVSVGYHWSGNNLSCIDCPNPIVAPNQNQQYIVEVYDNLGCAYSDTSMVSLIEALPAPTINDPQYVDGQVIFTWEPVPFATGYFVKVNNTNWITPNGSLSQTLNGYVLGDEIQFHVKALSAGGCDGTDASLQLKITDCLLTVGYTVDHDPSCVGVENGAITLSATNGTPSFQFSLDGSSFSATTSYTDLAVGSHFAMVLDDSGCKDTLVFELNPSKNLSLDLITNDISCNGANDGSITAQITGPATTPIDYNWQITPAQTTETINNLTPGAYAINITDAEGCTLEGVTNVTEPDALGIIFSNVIHNNCFGENMGTATANTSGGNLPYSYLWSSGETTQSIQDKPAGDYSVTVTDANGCSNSKMVTISQPVAPLGLTTEQTKFGCAYTKSSMATATATGGTIPYDYLWSNGQDNAIANNLASGNYSVTVTDANGCQESTSLSVMDLDPVIPTLDFTSPTCHDGNDGTVSVINIAGGNSTNLSDYTYDWQGQTDIDESIDSILGDRMYYVTVTGSTGCIGNASIYVSQPDLITISLDATPVTCAGASDGIAKVLHIAGNVGPYSIEWDTNAGSDTTNEVTNLSGGLYEVTVTNTLGCTGTNHIQVEEALPFSVAQLQAVSPLCASGSDGMASLQLNGGAYPYQYQWSTGATTDTISNLSDGTYPVTITDDHNCTIVDTIVLNSPDSVLANFGLQHPICFGEHSGSVEIFPQGGIAPYEYSLNNSSYSSNNYFDEMSAGTYMVYVRDQNGCVYENSTTLNQPPQFTIDAGPDLNLSYSEPVDIAVDPTNANGGISLTVIDPLANVSQCYDCDKITIIPNYHGVYQFVATDENGCIATNEVDIQVTRDQQFLVPTAFTPNSDGNNDYLTCHTKYEATVYYFKVFDRWGEQVYGVTDVLSNQKDGWDGYYKGKKMPSGIYVWMAEVGFQNGEHLNFQGQTTLIR